MSRIFALIYGVLVYLLFFGGFLYLVGFLANFGVPRSIDSGAPTAVGEALIVNGSLLLLFAITHTGMARPGFKAWWTRAVPVAVERSTYVLVATLWFMLAMWQWRSVPDVIWHLDAAAARYAVWALYGLGWGIVLVSTHLINHFELFGLQQVYFRWRGQDPPTPRFRVPLLYKLVRHPLMLGTLIAFWATPTMTVGHVMFAAGMTVYTLIGVHFEERDLVRKFGDGYREYQRTTSMLIPLPRRSARSEEAR